MTIRNDIHKILIIGSGPIVIGQACEFDYSGTQAVKTLKSLGFEVVLVNSNPATIMTDPDIADKTYIEPVDYQTLIKIIELERPDALLPTMGGQTGLNIAVQLEDNGILKKYGVQLIGASSKAIHTAEDRGLFRIAMEEIGLEIPRGGFANSVNQACNIVKKTGFPAIIRSAFTLGGSGGSIANNMEEFEELAEHGLKSSPVNQILIEESLIGWKEFELEVMRDKNDQTVVVCSIENFDPMGVHTGDSITVAPVQTLTDKEYQYMRDAAFSILRKIGVETGGSNVQFAVNPSDGRLVVVEMNPRVSRSSALASKATGFPIAKIAAQLAVGMTLDEIPNDITGKTMASFEPALDYIVVKIPRWNFDKFPQTKPILTTQMKSVGETMAIGRTFTEALNKAVRSLENDSPVLKKLDLSADELLKKIKIPTPERIFEVTELLRRGVHPDEIFKLTGIDPWFLYEIKEMTNFEQQVSASDVLTPELLYAAKKQGLSDLRISQLTDISEKEVRELRYKNNIKTVFKRVDTCAAEFESSTSYMYSTYETEDESNPSKQKKIAILGSGPNRIGQGIEFDYCCVHAVMELSKMGFETIMINNNPETVSTDYDISDNLYFEPLTMEDVMPILEREKPEGVIVQFGGQTPLKLAKHLKENGIRVLGTSPESIDLAEDREKFGRLLEKSDMKTPPWTSAKNRQEAIEGARKVGYPVLVRPSYVLGGRGMYIAYNDTDLKNYIEKAALITPEHPVLIDKFLEDAFEFDADSVSDGETTIICGIMQHIEEAGIHSGDSSCVLPPYMLSDQDKETIKKQTLELSSLFNVKGLMNVQFALFEGELYVLEVNPRASRTVPFVSKAKGIPWVKIAARVIAGEKLSDISINYKSTSKMIAVKTPVFPFMKFPNVHTFLGPEMKSTGEVMGIGHNFGTAFLKAYQGAGLSIPDTGTVFISVNDRDKPKATSIARQLYDLGFKITATHGTFNYLHKNNIPCDKVKKVAEGSPNVTDLIKKGRINLVINTPLGQISRHDEYIIGRCAMTYNVPCLTTLSASWAAVQAIRTKQAGEVVPVPMGF
ncbi:carbamoyl-phosphate synthase large subunit [bacterium]|nr:carbamoyl-phosphate synthase large subunit [bacterium]